MCVNENTSVIVVSDWNVDRQMIGEAIYIRVSDRK
jgi:hypothetical protein